MNTTLGEDQLEEKVDNNIKRFKEVVEKNMAYSSFKSLKSADEQSAESLHMNDTFHMVERMNHKMISPKQFHPSSILKSAQP